MQRHAVCCPTPFIVGVGRFYFWGDQKVLISIQFPLADSRGFVANTGRLRKPGWPLPTPDEEFVRSYGPVRIRPRGGLAGWVGENQICEAERAVRLSRALTVHSVSPSRKLPLRVAFRRFFFDGLAAGKFEIGLATGSRKPLNLRKPDVKSFVEDFLNLRVRITEGERSHIESPLIQAGKHLAHSYLSATTRKGYPNEPESWFIRSGVPILFLECSNKEKIGLPYFMRAVDLPAQYQFDLYHCLVPFHGKTIRMWYLDEYNYGYRHFPGEEVEAARRLRIYLQRLNAEHECLRLVLRNIMAKSFTVTPRSEASNALQHYFNEATKRIGILESKSASQFDDEICELARESMNALNPGQFEALNSVLGTLDLRKNILRKIEKYADKWSNVTIVENVEENHMGDVFKDINQSLIATRGSIAEGVITLRTSGNNQIADAISQLDQLIAGVADDDLSPKQKKECSDLLKSIVDEASKQEPNKNILRALGNTLLSIMTSVEPLARAAKTAFDILKNLWS